ncbi:ABC transporter permease [Staphylococcus pettenkoferi]|uniref:ABC transporter permease n=1 Tax=Staphylococcus pettenkoferi TaxID=170573 RepID=A0ABT4BNI7_9STAP|nr:ABC transporter permease [Staphylococcus pettenkoferi]MCY1565866.1 ABC transporter permease [Staphylococcus pettenkoferi]MCY1572731.1 ABC transporter permease [Staphylococcus pettenkoferi]MCY1584235.1 ABC transporter permease [Staphylococcus pettenkoferi]MCY1593456.1 ABC transporter permease [Staphylococcus pettenkoferi]MCY1598225.1 ABC transporter permease [Staphylococcus pettenkoferi]
MGTLIKQECFKLCKKKSTFIIPIIVILLMVVQAIISKNYDDVFSPQSSIESAFSGFSWFIFLLIIQASTIISMEFYHGTIKNLLYRKYTRTNIIISKIITLVIFSLLYFIISIVVGFILWAIFFNDINLLESKGDELSLLSKMLLTGLGTYVGTWLVLSVTLLISCAMKSPGVSIAVGIVFYFATSILSGILTIIVDKWEWLKWNPISMMNIMVQIIDKEMKKFTKLELHELFIGNIVYIIIFLILVVFVFKKKNV